MKQRFYTLERTRDRVQSTGTDAPPRQGDIQRFQRQLCVEFCRLDFVALGCERRFYLFFRGIEARAHGGTLLRRKLAETFLQFSECAGLAEITRLGVFELRRIRDHGKRLQRLLHDSF